tara:strand:- start:1484 stop:2326 length:843 start_codon:yes stop_codon:yes gene_type:complete
MQILLSGASGYIGRNLKRMLEMDGHDIVPLKIFLPNENSLAAQKKSLDQRLHHLNTRKKSIDVFIHLAWMNTNDWGDEQHLNINEPLSYYLIEKLSSLGVPKFVCVGSCLEYGMMEGRLDEEIEVKPENNYAKAKVKLFERLKGLSIQNGFSLSWLRLFYVYGGDQPENTLFGGLKRNLKEKNYVFQMSGGQQVRDYLHISEVCYKISLIASHTNATGIINICSGKAISLEDQVRTWLKMLEAPEDFILEMGALPYRTDEPFKFWGCNHNFSRLESHVLR